VLINDRATLLAPTGNYTLLKTWPYGQRPEIAWPAIEGIWVRRTEMGPRGWMLQFQPNEPMLADRAFQIFDLALPGATNTTLHSGDLTAGASPALTPHEATVLAIDSATGGAVEYLGETVAPKVGHVLMAPLNLAGGLVDAAQSTTTALSALPWVLLGLGAVVVVIVAWKGPELLKAVTS